MLEIIRCKNCGNSSIPLGAITINVTLKKHTWCEHCKNSDTAEQHAFFCSNKCFHEYMKKVINKEAELKWKELKIIDGKVSYE